ncbi:MAG: hypothetical protein H8E66_28900 [Planctomycetes bacterium]|nr:hypothetical protein [Planctomycetota bacterium]
MQQRRTSTSGSRQLAFTLVELLVSAAITLMLVYGLAQAFAVVSETVSVNRASVEMSTQMRSVALRLQQDLEGLTLPALPWPRPESGSGYLEYFEGSNHDGTGLTLDLDGDGTPGENTSFGDADDILMLTSRSADTPFRGSYTVRIGGVKTPTKIESDLAEIVWWTTLIDTPVIDSTADGFLDSGNGSLNAETNDSYTVYRRSLLIRPDLNTNTLAGDPYWKLLDIQLTAGIKNTFDTTVQQDLVDLRNALRQFYAENDLSVHFEPISAGGSSFRFYIIANTLEDLTMRERRFAHRKIVAVGSGSALEYFMTEAKWGFPYQINRDATSATGLPGNIVRGYTVANPGVVKTGVHQGEDVMLANTLAFDIRAYDPLAPLGGFWGEDASWGVKGIDDDNNAPTDDVLEAAAPNSDDECVSPGERGFATTAFNTTSIPESIQLSSSGGTARYFLPIGRGAFVDLNYAGKSHAAGSTTYTYNLLSSTAYSSHFSSSVASKSKLTTPTYDTWSSHYEYDGRDQNGNGTSDEGGDGIDNGGTTGIVDDAGERETSPPYAGPLRALQIRIRMIEHDARQIRQFSVTSNFRPE